MPRLLIWIASTCLLVLASASARADTLPRKLYLWFDHCTDRFLEAGQVETVVYSIDYECKRSRSGYACAPTPDRSSAGKLSLTARTATTGIVLGSTKGSLSIRVSLGDGGGTASLADRISTQDQHGSRFCSGTAGTAPRKPVSSGSSRTGIEACDRLVNMYMRCDKIPQQSRDAFLQGVEQWGKAIEAGGGEARRQIEDACRQTLDASRESFQAMGC